MNHSIFKIFCCKLFRGGSDITFLVPIASEISIKRSNKYIAPDIKRHKISLNNMRSRLTICSGTFASDNISNILNSLDNIYSTTLIRIFSRFDNPITLPGMIGNKRIPFLITLFLNMICLRDMIK